MSEAGVRYGLLGWILHPLDALFALAERIAPSAKGFDIDLDCWPEADGYILRLLKDGGCLEARALSAVDGATVAVIIDRWSSEHGISVQNQTDLFRKAVSLIEAL